MPKKKQTKTTKAVVKKEENKPAWESMTTIMSKSRDDVRAAGAYRTLMLSSKAFEIPPQGINIMGDQPYINKVGWKYKMYEKLPKAVIETEWIHYATPSEKWAIVKAVVKVGEETVGSAIGEATEMNIKLAAVKQTLNMMAETRAKNRAMYDALIGVVFKEAMKNIEAMRKKDNLTEEEVLKIQDAAKVTAEEMDMREQKVAPTAKPAKPASTTDYIIQLKNKLHALGANNAAAARKMYYSRTGDVLPEFEAMTQDEARTALTNLLSVK